ncbi:MAG: tRNA (adenosine(37)-N6)-threonylcarbamoyltransferase complex dimerization subunit type 1 TsaB [Verrucomicrobiota bacterium]|nr:tRNA (adenosine(37)-N6)-threonylcarbamoyltransferase complex dimerization subunit type 1 TsaB [Verrucomicrobiota bacterium]MDQ6939435.1 tRNA (adenosine(37)-N6)-threonylcarbamoyltransferase complex dimerization subunit type 1 TsaB [Verrucomicrobiota bacterium]
MKILALELSSGQGSIALREDGREIFAIEFANDRKHSGAFFENLQNCCEQFGNPERIVVGLGPGSYAGTRIAIAAAIGLQAASNAELIGLPSFCATATDAEKYCVVGDARRQSFWIAEVQARRCVNEPALCTREELAERLSFLSEPIFSAEALTAFPKIALCYPSARILASIAESSEDVLRAPLEPIYLREPHITQPKTARV